MLKSSRAEAHPPFFAFIAKWIVAVLSLSAAGVGASENGPAELIPADGIHISNDVLKLGISGRDAGAVNSLIYQGTELVNDHDHGRQLQIAWSYNDLGEAYNPTEAGSAPDGVGPSSSSQLLKVHADKASLTTQSHPAYWHPPGDVRKGHKPACTQLVTADTLEKTITLGYHDDPHIVVVDATITVSPELTGPPPTSIVVEAPAFYVPAIMTECDLLNCTTGDCVRQPSKSAKESKDPLQVLILSSADGRYAAALVAADSSNFMSYNSRYIARDGKSEDSLAKITLHYRQKTKEQDRLTYRSFVIVGDLATVKASVIKIKVEKKATPDLRR